MTVAAFERAGQSTDGRRDLVGALLQQRVALVTITTFVSLIVLVGQWTATLAFAGGVAILLAVGTLWLLAQRRTDVRKIVATGSMHLGVVMLVGTFV